MGAWRLSIELFTPSLTSKVGLSEFSKKSQHALFSCL
jgi:hypothetical protein